MNQGQSLTEVAAELERINTTKQDYLVPMSKLGFGFGGNFNDPEAKYQPAILGITDRAFGLTPWAFSQVNTYLGIPGQYAQRTFESFPGLWARSANKWAEHKATDKRMIRTLDGNARAFLSDAYRPLDGYDLACAALPALKDLGAVVRSSAITDTKLYLKAVVPGLETTIQGSRRVGDVIRAGVCLGTSEVGNGAVFFKWFAEVLKCTNGMVSESVLRKTHIGRRASRELSEATEYFSDRTRQLDDAAFWSKFKDVLAATVTRENLELMAARISATADQEIANTGEIEKVAEATVQRLSLPSHTKPGILKNLVENGDLTRWGLVNATTQLANEITDYELASTLEQAGGKLIDLSDTDWKVISEGTIRKQKAA